MAVYVAVFRCKKSRVDGQKLQTETLVFEFSKLVTLLCLFLAATKSDEGLNYTVLEQYLEFFETTKTNFPESYEFHGFLSFVSYTTPRNRQL